MAENGNRHVKDYLGYYIGFKHSPHYAVMVVGPWGIGKTYLVKKFLDETTHEPEKYVYVSLFGLTTLDEIDGALIEATYPLIASKGAKITGRIFKAALKFKGIDLNLGFGELVDKFSPGIFVFDDLERCEMPVNVVMGYINEFVEHEGCKVIIVANEKEIAGGEQEPEAETTERREYVRRREKIVGKTLEVQSALTEAFQHFVASISHVDTKRVFETLAADIKAIYSQSDLNNLRILQQTMWDFERVFRTLTDEQRNNSEAAAALLRLLFALSFEIKAGRLRPDDLRSRTNWLFTLAMKEEGKDDSRRRYPEVDMTDRILSDDALIDILVRGIVDETTIRDCLDRSRYFMTVASERSWLTVWNMFDRTDQEFEAAYDKMERQFAAREFTSPGEVLHVLGARLFLARNGVSGKTVSAVAEEGKRYIDALYNARHLDLPASEMREIRFNGNGGLGFLDHESAEFQELGRYLMQKSYQAATDRYPDAATKLFNEMKTDPDLFLRRICLTNEVDLNLYYNVPILPFIQSDAFVETLISLHPSHQRTIARSIRGRYEFGGLRKELASERSWLEDVLKKLTAKAETMSPIGKYRLLSGIKTNIVRALDNAKEG